MHDLNFDSSAFTVLCTPEFYEKLAKIHPSTFEPRVFESVPVKQTVQEQPFWTKSWKKRGKKK